MTPDHSLDTTATLGRKAKTTHRGQADNLLPYDQYELVDLGWETRLPATWTALRLKHLVTLMKRPVQEDDEIVTCFRDGTVTLRSNRRTDGFTNADKEIGYQGVRKGDLVIHAMDAFAGAIGVSDSDGKSTPVYSVCAPLRGKANAHYLSYALREMARRGYITSLGQGIRERSTDFRWSNASEVMMPVPPFEEQCRIAAFLDHETARIDELVREQERLSDLAGQKRIASIRELTHFGPSQGVELQSTGIDWIPQVPTHWRLSQIGFEARVGNGSTPARENASYWQDGEIPWMNSSKINEGFITGADQFVSQKALQECHLPRVPAGSVLIAITGEGRTRGLSAITGIDTTINQHLAYVSVTSGGLLPEYLRYYLEGQYEHLRHESSGTGSTRAALTCGFIQKYPVPVPPLAEQQSIVDVLNRDLSQLSSLVENAETMKQLLLERRSALISAAVTGQLDLSDWQLPEPEAVAEVA